MAFRRSTHALLIRAGAALLLSSALNGCGGSNRESLSAAGLPPYTSAEARVFDDSFAPEIFDLPSDRSSAAEDPKLAQRAQRADFVVRAKIVTVSRDQRGGQLTYQIVFKPVQAPLSGHLTTDVVEASLRPRSPSIPLVEHQEAGLTGKVIVLLGRYYNERGEVVLHFRAEADTGEVLQGVERAKVIDDFEG